MWAAFDKKLTKDGFAPNHAPVFLHIFYAIEGVTHASRLFGCVGAPSSLQGFAYSPIPMWCFQVLIILSSSFNTFHSKTRLCLYINIT